ncbi:MAG: hypothetical protein IIU02_01015, partial [Treponema sp.]|uniref:hypothetical protein n=1 Tax=Treponema sp. TaxID=166 RepID=UPI002579E8D9
MGIFLRTALKAALISALVFAGCAADDSSEIKGDSLTGVSDVNVISAADTPVGYASITPQTGTGTTVTTKTELVNALKKGGLIYVSGTIDVSEGCLPSEAGGTTPQLDAFVAATTNSSYSKYSDF